MQCPASLSSPPRPSVRPLIAIPAYNSAGALRGVVEEALVTGLPVLVVDDGSTDASLASIDGLPVERIVFAENRGKGAAILAAAAWAERAGFSHVITVDSDGQHRAAEAARFLPKIERDPLAIVVGRRRFEADVPASSRFGRSWSNMWLRIASGAECPDSQCGFRAYPVEVLRRVRCRSRRYDFEIEILARAAWAGAAIDSVDVSVRYFRDEKRISHFRPVLDNARISVAYTRLVTRHLIPWPHRVLFSADPDPIRLSWAHPLVFWMDVHRKIFRKVGDEKKLSLRHPIKSLKLLHEERTTPKDISLATALGVFLGALPLIGIHCIAIGFYATRLRLNRPIAIYASNICAPFIPPFVPALGIELGHYLFHGAFITLPDVNTKQALLRTLGKEIHLRLGEYFIGSTILSPFLAVLAGLIVWFVLALRPRKSPRPETHPTENTDDAA
jgi:glycosyltransferase involved in cell wall biosynthesis